MKKLPPMPKDAERSLDAYDRAIRKMQRTLSKRYARMTHEQICDLVKMLDRAARVFLISLAAVRIDDDEETDVPPIVWTLMGAKAPRPESWAVDRVRTVAGEIWRLRHQPQDL